MPEILVILPTLGDRLDTLEETLRSVEMQRADQTLSLILVTPVNAVEARNMGLRFGATIVDDPGIGIASAINEGLKTRRTEKYYAWIGDDDLFRSKGLKILVDLIESDKRNVVAFGGCDYIDGNGRVLGVSNAGLLALFLLPWGPDLIPHPGSLIKLDALETIGGFDESLKYVLDLDAFLKLRKLGKFAFTRKSVSAFRWHSESLTVSNRLASSKEAEQVKRSHLPAFIRPISYLWSYPVRWASAAVASSLGK